MPCCRNNTLKVELPLLMKFTGAHDNIPTYELLEHWGINALIDINVRAKSSQNAPDDITFNKEDHSLCKADREMCPWGNDPVKDAHKYRCPVKCGRIEECPHADECSTGSYGRTVYIKNHGDLRFHPRIPRDSKQFFLNSYGTDKNI